MPSSRLNVNEIYSKDNPTQHWLRGQTEFPAGHVVQTVHQTFNQTTQQTSYAEVATHIEKSITITAGNKVFYHFTIPTRLFASGYQYGQFYYILVNKVGSSGTYSAVGTQSNPNNANIYYDKDGTLPTDFYRYFNVNFSGIHTPSSGTEQYYRINVKHIQGNDVTVGLGTSSETLMVLQEIQT